MTGGKKARQVRRCAICQKVGHNKSTCPVALLERAKPSVNAPRAPMAGSAAPLKFFVHHVAGPEKRSPFVVDLKAEEDSVWGAVTPAAPERSTGLFANYHRLPARPFLDENPPVNPRRQKGSIKSALLKYAGLIKNIFPRRAPRLEPPALAQKNSLSPAAPKANLLGESLRLRILALFKRWLNNLAPLLKPRAASFVTALAVILILLPFQARSYYLRLSNAKQEISSNATAGFIALYDSASAILHADFSGAEVKNNAALAHFSEASTALAAESGLLKNIAEALPILGDQLSSREKILLAGHELALGNAYFLNQSAFSPATGSFPGLKFVNWGGAANIALPNYRRAFNYISEVNPEALPFEYRAAFKDFKSLFSAAVGDLAKLASLNGPWRELLGFNGRRRFLIVFQNPNELRPTGGFMGALAIIEVKDGRLLSLNIPPGGSYDLQGQLNVYLTPPAPLTMVNKRWEFQDANWFPDWQASAEKILWFYRQARGVSADGLIAINAPFLKDLLAITGPITDPTSTLSFTEANALELLQEVVENGPDKALNRPKQIIADLAPEIIKRLFTLPPQAALALGKKTHSALTHKDIQIYLADEPANAALASLGWGGKIKPTAANQDYVFAVNANIRGAKSDARMSQDINHQAVINDDGSVIDTVTITRRHNGSNDEPMYGQTNIDYLRLYVPEGSQLISAKGFSWPDESRFRAPYPWSKADDALLLHEQEVGLDEESGTRITQEFGKTAFGNWLITEPGGVSTAYFTYRLPWRVFASPSSTAFGTLSAIAFPKIETSRYQLTAVRQSGGNSTFESQIIYPRGWRPAWQEGPNSRAAANGLQIGSAPLEQDTVWSLIMKH